MLKYIIIITLLLGSLPGAYAQHLISADQGKITSQIETVLKAKRPVVRYEPIRIDKARFDDSFVSLKFLNEPEIRLKRRKLDVRGPENFSWFAKNEDNTTNAIIAIRNNDVQGLIYHGLSTYRIETIHGQYVIEKLNQSLFPPESCPGNNVVAKPQDLKQPSEPKEPENNPPIRYKRNYPSQVPGNFECKLRLLVVYNWSAREAVSDIHNSIQIAMDDLNNALSNSGVNFEAELAYEQEVGYSYTNYDQDVKRLADPGDGHMDDVAGLREKYSADVCVLFIDNDAFCGVAKAIRACQEDAFCIVNVNCIGVFSFAHEIGHLLGCRHNVEFDNDDDPYPHGHGFNDGDLGFRTIMSIGCPGADCPRIPFFSNPNLTFSGRPLGNNDARNFQVLNFNIPQYMTFRPAPAVRTVIQADVAELSDMVYTKTKIATSGTVSIASTKSYYFAAGTDIELTPGFEALEGNTFVAEIINNCGTTYSGACSFNEVEDPPIYVSNAALSGNFSVFPNPTKSLFSIRANTSYKTVEVSIVNALGSTIDAYEIADFKAGISTNVDLSAQPSGVYFLQLKSNDDIFLYKIIKQ